MIVIVAGVSGSGKTTVGALVAGRMNWRFADADSFHSEANVAKMRAGIPLTDEDRKPWLKAVADWIDARIAAGQSAVIGCSALKRAYRDFLLTGRPEATMVFLWTNKEMLARRLTSRQHFFPERLLNSQLDALEPPSPDERQVVKVLAEGEPGQTELAVIERLGLVPGAAAVRREGGPGETPAPA